MSERPFAPGIIVSPLCCILWQDVGYTAETAEYFQLYHVTSRIEKFEADLEQRRSSASGSSNSGQDEGPPGSGNAGNKDKSGEPGREATSPPGESAEASGPSEEAKSAVKDLFPFTEFFKNAPAAEGLFGAQDLEADLETARGCFRHIEKVRCVIVHSRVGVLLLPRMARGCVV